MLRKNGGISAFRSTLSGDRVTIDDDGPGLAAGLRQAALSRGKRLDETKPGSGMGLSIVGDLATLYGGDLSLEDSPKADCARTSGYPRHEINRLAAKYL